MVPARDESRNRDATGRFDDEARGFDGLDIPAILIGVLVAVALELILAGIVLAVAGRSFDLSSPPGDLTLGAALTAIAITTAAFLAGGWAAARIGRGNGQENGIMVAIGAMVLGAVAAGVGALLSSADRFFAAVGLPGWFSEGVTSAAVVSVLTALAAMLVGAAVGGTLGEHRGAPPPQTTRTSSEAG